LTGMREFGLIKPVRASAIKHQWPGSASSISVSPGCTCVPTRSSERQSDRLWQLAMREQGRHDGGHSNIDCQGRGRMWMEDLNMGRQCEHSVVLRSAFVPFVERTLRISGADPKRLKLEITESFMMERIDDVSGISFQPCSSVSKVRSVRRGDASKQGPKRRLR
jgi:hypothetical protein